MKVLSKLFAFAAVTFYLLSPGAIIFAAAPMPTCQLSVNPSSINIGGSVTLTWNSTNATGGAITNVGNVALSGSINLLPSAAAYTTYIGSFTGAGGTANCSATVTVSSANNTLGNNVTTGSDTSNPVDVGSATSVTNAGTAPVTPVTSAPLPAAPASGLIPCGYTDNLTTGIGTSPASPDANGCQACDLATLIQNVINFLIGLSIPLAAALFAWAGVLYFTSAGDHHKLDQAKGIFRNAIIGFVIVITAWLVVNTVLHVLFSQGEFASGNWFTIQCSQSGRAVSGNIGTVLNNVLGNGQVLTPTTNTSFDDRFNGATTGSGATGPVPVCAAGSTYVADYGGCYNSDTQVITQPTAYTYANTGGNSAAGTAQWTQQLAEACSTSGLNSSNCLLAQAVMANESSGKSGVISGAGCVGLMQVCPSTACGLNPNIQGCSTGDYSTVTQQLTNPQLNMQLGTQLISSLSQSCSGDPACIAAAYNGGLGATRSSNTCAGTTVWQCTANSGYAETRNYVPKVLSTFNTLQQ